MRGTTHLLLALLLVGSGAAGGVFLAFSSFVMGALGRLAPAEGIRAMQSINVVVLNPLFMTVLFGTALVAVLAVALGWSQPAVRGWLLAAALVYLVGVVGVTMGANVPLNDQLAAVRAGDPQGAGLWSHYLAAWTGWNHVRAVAGLGTSLLTAIAWRAFG